jgi:hypothetical protein
MMRTSFALKQTPRQPLVVRGRGKPAHEQIVGHPARLTQPKAMPDNLEISRSTIDGGRVTHSAGSALGLSAIFDQKAR